MEESHREGLTTHPDPESCAAAREDGREALTGARLGEVLSRESRFESGVPTLSIYDGRRNGMRRYREAHSGSTRSETLGTNGTSLRGNREIPRSTAIGDAVRTGKSKDATR